MNKFQSKNDLIGYIERSITDIARKCGVKDSDVVNEIKARYFREAQ